MPRARLAPERALRAPVGTPEHGCARHTIRAGAAVHARPTREKSWASRTSQGKHNGARRGATDRCITSRGGARGPGPSPAAAHSTKSPRQGQGQEQPTVRSHASTACGAVATENCTRPSTARAASTQAHTGAPPASTVSTAQRRTPLALADAGEARCQPNDTTHRACAPAHHYAAPHTHASAAAAGGVPPRSGTD